MVYLCFRWLQILTLQDDCSVGHPKGYTQSEFPAVNPCSSASARKACFHLHYPAKWTLSWCSYLSRSWEACKLPLPSDLSCGRDKLKLLHLYTTILQSGPKTTSPLHPVPYSDLLPSETIILVKYHSKRMQHHMHLLQWSPIHIYGS